VQEENLLDLAADGTVSTAKIRTRLRSIETRRGTLQAELTDSNTKLAAGARAVESILALLRDASGLYQRSTDGCRRLLNEAVFEKLYVYADEVTEDRLREPFRRFVEAARQAAPTEVHEGRETEIPPKGRDPGSSLSALFGFSPSREGSNKCLVVGVAGFEPTTSASRTQRSTKLSHTPELCGESP
jgi:hypothetical protein